MIEINKSLHGANGKIKAVYLGTTPVVMYLGNQLLYDVDLDGEYVLMNIKDGDTVDSTIEAPVKSAMLKGNTLINLVDSYEYNVTVDNRAWGQKHVALNNIKTNTTYTMKVETQQIVTSSFTPNVEVRLRGGNYAIASTTGGVIKFISGNEVFDTHLRLVVTGANAESANINFKIVVLEGDYTNIDIPYFDGMQSVKMYGLTTTGKNLFNPNETKLGFFYDKPEIQENYHETFPCLKTNNLKPNTKYTVPAKYGLYITFFDKNEISLGYFDTNTGNVLTTPNNTYYTLLRPHKDINSGMAYNSLDEFKNDVQIEKGSNATSYEPYKSNILTINEDVTLRGVGNVQDTLDLMTGELVQIFGNLHFDGSENWNIFNRVGAMVIAKLNLPNLEHKFYATTSLSDKVPVVGQAWTGTKGISLLNKDVYLTIEQSIANTNDDIKNWISSIGGINLIYKLSQSTVKTVDITMQDQDNKTISTLNTFNDTTHFTVQGEEGKLQPTVSMEIACNPSQAISKLSDKTEQLQQEQQELTEQVKQQEQDTNILQTATTDLEEV